IVAETTAPPCSSYQCGKSVPPPTKLIRNGATASIVAPDKGVADEPGAMAPQSMGRPRGESSGDVTLEPAPLLLRGAAPHAVPLAVLQRPRQAFLADGAHCAEGERGAGLLFGDREEDVGFDAETRGSLLPEIRRRGWHRERRNVDLREPLDPH